MYVPHIILTTNRHPKASSKMATEKITEIGIFPWFFITMGMVGACFYGFLAAGGNSDISVLF